MTTEAAAFFVEKDAYNEPALWTGTGPGDNRCQVVALKRELDAMHPVLWPTLTFALVPLDADPAPISAEDVPAFRRMLLLLKVQFDAGEICGEPWTDNADAFALLMRLCAEYGVA